MATIANSQVVTKTTAPSQAAKGSDLSTLKTPGGKLAWAVDGRTVIPGDKRPTGYEKPTKNA